MTIETSSSGLAIIDRENSLSSIHLRQLQFWGFQKSTDSPFVFCLNAEDCRQTFGKLIGYFDDEQLKYTLGPNCRIQAAKIQAELTELVRVREAGKSIKGGKFDAKHSAEFSSALQSKIKRKLKLAPRDDRTAETRTLVSNTTRIAGA